MSPFLQLVGGPYDGAEGFCDYAGEPSLFVRLDPERRGPNGLLVRPDSGRGGVHYCLAGSDGVFVYTVDGFRAPVDGLVQQAMA